MVLDAGMALKRRGIARYSDPRYGREKMMDFLSEKTSVSCRRFFRKDPGVFSGESVAFFRRVPDEKYSQGSCLSGWVGYGLHLWHILSILLGFSENAPKSPNHYRGPSLLLISNFRVHRDALGPHLGCFLGTLGRGSDSAWRV